MKKFTLLKLLAGISIALTLSSCASYMPMGSIYSSGTTGIGCK